MSDWDDDDIEPPTRKSAGGDRRHRENSSASERDCDRGNAYMGGDTSGDRRGFGRGRQSQDYRDHRGYDEPRRNHSDNFGARLGRGSGRCGESNGGRPGRLTNGYQDYDDESIWDDGVGGGDGRKKHYRNDPRGHAGVVSGTESFDRPQGDRRGMMGGFRGHGVGSTFDHRGGYGCRGGPEPNPDSIGQQMDNLRMAPPYIPKEEEPVDKLFDEGIHTGINFDKYDDIDVEVTGTEAPPAIGSFEQSGLKEILLENVRKSHYTKPTPVQKGSIPAILKGRDLMSCAQTGSGKTAAFLLPILHKLLEEGVENNVGRHLQTPEVLIISPTRELASQIKDEARKFSAGTLIRATCIYGGVCPKFQTAQLRRGTNIVIATPGRLIDFLDRGKVSFERVRFLVLDEADRMLHLGFMPDIHQIVQHRSMPDKSKRTTLMFSATFPRDIQEAAAEFLRDYLFLRVGIVGGACVDVTQSFIKTSSYPEKLKTLVQLVKDLMDVGNKKIMVFVGQKRTADILASYLSDDKLPTTSIHGDRYQEQREEALRDFTSGRMSIIVGTDVAARGLDVPNVTNVINFDLPDQIDDYVHRIGRTGRIGNTGKATSFYDATRDGPLATKLVKVLSDAQQEVPEWLQNEAMKYAAIGPRFGVGGPRNVDEKFSSRDIRNQGKEKKGSAFQKEVFEDDECWD